MQVVAPAGAGAADAAEALAGRDALALLDHGGLDHVHVDVGAVALAVVEIDVVALAAVGAGSSDDRRRRPRPAACRRRRRCPGRRGRGPSERRRRRSRRCRSRPARRPARTAPAPRSSRSGCGAAGRGPAACAGACPSGRRLGGERERRSTSSGDARHGGVDQQSGSCACAACRRSPLSVRRAVRVAPSGRAGWRRASGRLSRTAAGVALHSSAAEEACDRITHRLLQAIAATVRDERRAGCASPVPWRVGAAAALALSAPLERRRRRGCDGSR